jgi:hypothetical protein
LLLGALALLGTACNECDSAPTCGIQVLVINTSRLDGGRVEACVEDRCHTVAIGPTALPNTGAELGIDLDQLGLWPDTIARPETSPPATTFPGRQGFDVRLTLFDRDGQVVTSKQVRARRQTAPCSCPHYSARL